MANYHDSIHMMETKLTHGAVLERPTRITPRRPVKMQVCLTPAERVRLSEQARAAGFETVSAFVRARTLGPAG
jgi:hypothetical protein